MTSGLLPTLQALAHYYEARVQKRLEADPPSLNSTALHSSPRRRLLSSKPHQPLKMPVQRKRGKKLGQAAVMAGKLWNQWRKHLLKTSPPWVWAAVTLTHILCARISEVLALKAGDFHWAGKRVTICALKRQPEAGVLDKSLARQ